MANRAYTNRELRGIRVLYADKLQELGVRRFTIRNRRDHTGVIITLPKPFSPGTRWGLIYGVPADINIKPRKQHRHRP